MFDFDENLVMTLIFYLGLCYVLYMHKHPIMFDEDGNFKCFGLNKNETVFPYWLVVTIVGLFIYTYLVIREKDYL